jgi:hypothetical protein
MRAICLAVEAIWSPMASTIFDVKTRARQQWRTEI